jgi:hypothetical protein
LSATVRQGSSANCWNTIETVCMRRSRRPLALVLYGLTGPVAVETDLAAHHGRKSVDGAQQRRFAGAGEAHQDEDFAFLDGQRSVGDAQHQAGRSADLVAGLALIASARAFSGLSPKTMLTLSKRTAVMRRLLHPPRGTFGRE